MSRLIRAIRDEEYFESFIEIIYPKSKYSGYRGWIGPNLVNEKFRITLPPAIWEQTNENHIFYIKPENIYKWVNIIRKADEGKNENKSKNKKQKD